MSHAPEPGTDDPLSLHGVVPPTITAFNEDESVNYEATAAHAQYVVDGGAHGAFPPGTNGEFPLLTGEEKRSVVEAVTDAVDDAPVIAGVGAPSTYETIQNAEHAESVGADGLVVITPYYYPLDHDAAVEHYRRVCEAVDLPVYIYHIPSKTGNSLSLDTLSDLAEIPNLAGLKDSSKDVPWLGQAIDGNPDLTFLFWVGLAHPPRTPTRLYRNGERGRERVPGTHRFALRRLRRGRRGARPRTPESGVRDTERAERWLVHGRREDDPRPARLGLTSRSAPKSAPEDERRRPCVARIGPPLARRDLIYLLIPFKHGFPREGRTLPGERITGGPSCVEP